MRTEDGFCYLSLEMVWIRAESENGIVRRFFKEAQVFVFGGFGEGMKERKKESTASLCVNFSP